MNKTTMKKTTCLAIAGCFIAPQSLSAAQPSNHQYIERSKIEFSEATQIAFDRSGKFVTSRILADGSKITELNGSMRSVTVARVGPDGKIETYCTTDVEAAKDWMAGKINPSPARIVAPTRRVK